MCALKDAPAAGRRHLSFGQRQNSQAARDISRTRRRRQRERQQLQQTAQHRSAAGVPPRQGSHRLGERPHLTARIAARQTAYGHRDQYLPSARGQVLQQPPVVPVPTHRHHTTARARGGPALGPRSDQHLAAAINDLFQHQPGQVGEEHLQASLTCRLNDTLHNELRGRLLTIKFLVEPDPHRAATPMRGQLQDRDQPPIPDLCHPP